MSYTGAVEIVNNLVNKTELLYLPRFDRWHKLVTNNKRAL